jgi:NADH-quinone oxidoreductase subunit L
MGKSAQVPLHVWLPDSMEGPTPISALIHAATMVTAGIFMVARMSPLFELSETALSFVLGDRCNDSVVHGLPGHCSERHQACCCLLDPVSAWVHDCSAGRFRLFGSRVPSDDARLLQGLLFLGAGSVIIGMHHDQDMRNMGGLWKYMPITWFTSLLGSLALIGFPFLSGFYSKDMIIEAVKLSHIPGAGYAYFCVIVGVFVTAFYSFRMYFLVFHGEERFGKHVEHDAHHDDGHAHDHADQDHDDHDDHAHHGLAPGQKPHESPWVVTLPLVLLAIPSVVVGFLTIEPMLFGGFFNKVIHISESHGVLKELAEEFHGAVAMGVHGLMTLPFALAMSGVVLAWFFYMVAPSIPAAIMRTFKPIHTLLENKYYFDRFNEIVFAGGARLLGRGLWKFGDQAVIDGMVVNGSAKFVGFIAQLSRLFQSGHIYQYAFSMIFGVVILLTFWFNRG